MYKLASLYLLLLLCNNSYAQVFPIEVGQLPDILSEPSGIDIIYNETNGQFEYWMHNDYENTDSIFSFRLDDLSSPSRIMDVGRDYIDWEDMTSDLEGNIYLGDFGNWVKEDELQIIKVPNPNAFSGSPPSTEVIKYQYPYNGIADMEAMFHHEDYIYLFTKSVRSDQNPNLDEGLTYCFRIPDYSLQDGNKHTAELIGYFQVILPGDIDPSRVKVTAADISPDGKNMVLLCYERLWVFSCFENSDFFTGRVKQIPLLFKQYEGIAFTNNHEVLITKEGDADKPDFNPKLFYLNLHTDISEFCLNCQKISNGNFDMSDKAWTLFTATSGTATASLDMTGGQATISVSQLSSSQWHANMRHKSLILEKGKTYKLKYKAHADQATTISVIINNAQGNKGYFYATTDLSSQSALYNHEFTMDEETDFNSYLSFNVGNSALTNIYLDEIKLAEQECLDLTTAIKVPHYRQDLVSLYPNPTIDGLNVIYEDWGLDTKVDLYAPTSEYLGTFSENYIETSALSKGLYFLVIKEGTRIISVKKFIKS